MCFEMKVVAWGQRCPACFPQRKRSATFRRKPLMFMSAIGPKQTRASALQMSTFGGKADIRLL